MNHNTTISLDSIVMVKKIENHFDLFYNLFNDIKGKSKDFIPLSKNLTCYKLTHYVPINQINNTYPLEFMQQIGLKNTPPEKSMYRTLGRI